MAHSLDQETYKKQVASVWRVTIWLSVITVIEVVAALIWLNFIGDAGPKMVLNSLFIVLSLLKAYFIVGEFMHIKYETRALTLTVLVPTVFLIWFIIAFLWEGAEWQNNREMWNVIIEETTKKIPHGGGHH